MSEAAFQLEPPPVLPGPVRAVIPDIDLGSHSYGLAIPAPRVPWDFPRLPDKHTPQFRRAEELEKVGLWSKARRHRVCGLIAKKYFAPCCERRVFVRFCCRNRYCPVCAKRQFEKLFNECCRSLLPVIYRLVPEWPVRGRRPERVIAKVDLTIRNVGHMPTPEEVRRFNQDVKRFFREIEGRYCAKPVHVGYRIALPKDEDGKSQKCKQRVSLGAGLEERLSFAVEHGGVVLFLDAAERAAVEAAFAMTGRRFWKVFRHDYAVLYCDEFGGAAKRPIVNRGLGNTNLHAHGVYCGPWLPQTKEKIELSALWSEIRGERSFVSIKPANSPQAAIAHALKYAGKFLSSDPERLAQLEQAFNGSRRVHTLGAFFDRSAEHIELEGSDGKMHCPFCPRESRGFLMPEGEGFEPVFDLLCRGYLDYDAVRVESSRTRVFGVTGSP